MQPSHDHSLRAAALILLASVLPIACAAALGLGAWPGKEVVDILSSGSLLEAIVKLSGYSIVFCVIFWGSKPRVTEQITVLVSWIFLSATIFIYIKPQLPANWAQDLLPPVMFLATTLMLPCAGALLVRLARRESRSDLEFSESRLRWLFIFTLLFICLPGAALSLTKSLHPYTLDLLTLQYDAQAGIDISRGLTNFIEGIPGLSELVWMAYGLTPLAFLAVAVLQLRQFPAYVPSAVLVWVLLTLTGTVAYHFFPIVGPRYVFGSAQFLTALENPGAHPLVPVQIPADFPRNGMPSLHFGWMLAATILWFRSGTRAYSKAIFATMTALVAMATLYTGEHYTIDLIVAAPFVMAAISLSTTERSLCQRRRWTSVGLGFGIWLTWVLALRFGIDVFVAHPVLTWVPLLLTAAVVIAQWRLQQPVLRSPPITAVTTIEKPTPQERHLTRRAGLMFFVSGAAALIYQVLFAKELALIFGSTSTATLTVLATFLGGMAIGSLIGGSVVTRTKSPIRLYALIELAIGVFCIATPALFSAVQSLYVELAAGMAPEAPVLFVLRIALGAGVLLVPTVLMGITLPLLTKALNPAEDNAGPSVAWLYACNTGGAAIGALLASYAVIPALGVRSTTLIAALLNFLVALGALELSKSLITGLVSAPAQPSAQLARALQPRRVLFAAWFALAAGGLLSLGLEVIYVHMLSIVAGNSVYAFGLMLATFLTGLALGGEAGRRLLQRPGTPIAVWLAWTQIALAVMVTLGTLAWDAIPGYFGSFANYPVVNGFRAHEAIRGLVCAAVMVPPTVLIGLSYTLAMDLATAYRGGQHMKRVGISAALNTTGNIIGVFLFGFVLLPLLGGLQASRVAALIALVIALVVMLAATRRAWARPLTAGLAAATALLVSVPATLDYRSLGSGASVYFAAQDWGDIIDQAESVDGGLTMVAHKTTEHGELHTLLTNGKFQGNDATEGEVKAQIGFAAMSLLHQPSRSNALVIGYGTGMTSRVLHDAGFQHLDIAELSRDVVRLADGHFASINQRVSQLPGVTTHITDGRNMLLLSPQRYDIISIEITSIWFAGAASLYNQEFYALAKARMAADGVLQQWVQLHHMAQTDLLTIIGTLRAQFKYVSMYVVGGQGVLIATNDERRAQVDATTVTALDQAPGLKAIRGLAGRPFADMAADQALTPAQTDALLDKVGIDRSLWVSTDNNLRLEYSTPKANVLNPDPSVAQNMKLLESARAAYAASQHKAASQEASR